MRIKDGFELREICGEHVILSHGMDNIDFSKIISLNETAAFLWKEAVGKEEISEEERRPPCWRRMRWTRRRLVRTWRRCLPNGEKSGCWPNRTELWI